jgi:hypothetical protein
VHRGFWWENVKVRDHLENLVVDGRIIFKRIFMKWDAGGTCTGLVWLKKEGQVAGSSGHGDESLGSINGVSQTAEELAASRELLCFMELVN